MGSHGRSRIDRALFGSVAETVTRRARIPMTTSTESSGQEGQKGGPQLEDPLRMQSDGDTMTDRQYGTTMQCLGRSHDSD
ncbi:hypothetical protein HSB1_04310 [Halogranum salarium B-1]|uniref:UspA domain-containing protein n=1 Tax=Halogranum salarium B-1 TaxID=1210908 RepID=J2ZKY7_9EURY|nr:hypothetical protein HSB1_04310 [Halogranum salarium B-1]